MSDDSVITGTGTTGTTEVAGGDGRRERNPRGSGGRLRDDIVDAGADLLAEVGDEELVSLRAVARRVGVAAPSLYRHFPDRETLMTAVVERIFDELIDAIDRGGRDLVDPVERLRGGCRGYVGFALERPGQYRVLFSTPCPPGAEDRFDAPGRRAFATLVDGIAACVAAGRADIEEPFAGALAVWPALHGIASLRSARPVFPWPPLEDALETMLVRLLRLR